MKLNWGTSILFFIIFFLSLCTIFIIFSLRQDIDLVTEEYYQEGANFTSEMEISERSKTYKDSISISLGDGNLEFELAPSIEAINTLDLWFYRPSDKDEDFRTVLEIEEAPHMLSTEKLNRGRYILHISWDNEGLSYHIKKNIFIN